MKSAHNLLHWRYLLVVVLVLGSAMTGAAPVFAATGSVTSAATPSNTTPSVGGSITVAININMSGVSAPDNALGSFTRHVGLEHCGAHLQQQLGAPPAGFTGVVNTASAGSGHITFNGANTTGATGNLNVLSITFDVVAAGTSALNLEYSAMAAATSFANLLPNLTITDGSVTAGGAASHTVTFNANNGTGTIESADRQRRNGIDGQHASRGPATRSAAGTPWLTAQAPLMLTARATPSRQTSRCMPSGRRWRTTR